MDLFFCLLNEEKRNHSTVIMEKEESHYAVSTNLIVIEHNIGPRKLA